MKRKVKRFFNTYKFLRHSANRRSAMLAALWLSSPPFFAFVERLRQRCQSEETAVRIANIRIAREQIMEYVELGGHLNDHVGSQIACPICNEGDIIFTYAGHYNGHISAQCTSAGCVGWIE